jgi:two-component system phosphate regulon sensor histidine kinase PhoR
MNSYRTSLPFWERMHLPNMLFSPRVRWRTAFSYAVAILLVMAALTFFLNRQASSIYTANTVDQFAEQAKFTAANPALATAWAQGEPTLAALLKQWSAILGGHATAILADGTIVADSHVNAQQLENSGKLPEVRDALDTGQGRSIRDDEVLQGQAFFVAFLVHLQNGQTGMLRWAFPLQPLETSLSRFRNAFFWYSFIATLLIIGLMVFQAERAAYTVRHLTELVERITQGDLNARIHSFSTGEIGQLARAFNLMANRLQKQIGKRAREKDRLNTVLNVMTDGVLILNKHGRVRLINPAAAHILQVPEPSETLRTFVQVVRDHRIVEVWNRCQQNGQEESATVELEGDRFIRIVVTPLFKSGSPTTGERGHLVIIQDLTRLHQLQTVRQDFVSNISHELRTPLASLRALVDTLNDGALDDPPAAQRFLLRMEVEVDALTQMVQELLELSRIESGKVPLVLRSTPVMQAIAPAAERLGLQAERADIALTIDLPTDLPNLMVDADRIQQVVTNLVHNAIKFTPAGGWINIAAQSDADAEMVTIRIKDSGVGIAADDLTRIFERFYKADRSRSGARLSARAGDRTTGGTGLGLAIAKHIVQAHGGRIWVESVVGKGSTFYFSLPITS